MSGLGETDQAHWRLGKDGLVQRKPSDASSQLHHLMNRLDGVGWLGKFRRYAPLFWSAEQIQPVARPKVSVVIVSWRYLDDTLENLKALDAQRGDLCQVVFVDNGAATGTFDALRPYINVYVRLSENTGAYLARNVGAAFCDAPILIFVDDDGLVAPDFIEQHLGTYNEYDIVAWRGPCKLKTQKGQEPAMYCPGPAAFPLIPTQEGNAGYRADIFYRIGGWDDNIVMGHGGLEISRRIAAVEPDRRKQIYAPGPVLYHDVHWYPKKATQHKASWAYLIKKHPDIGGYVASFKQYLGRPETLVRRDTGAGGPAARNSAPEQQKPVAGYPGIEHLLDSILIAISSATAQRAPADPKQPAGAGADGDIIDAAIEALNGNRNEEALTLFDAAIVSLQFPRAVALARLKRIDEARRTLEALLQRNPGHEQARAFLARLKSSSTPGPDA